MVQSRHLISDTNFTVGFVNIDTPSENLQLHKKSGMAKHLQTPEKRNLINVEMTVLKCDRWDQFYWILNEKNCYFTHNVSRRHKRSSPRYASNCSHGVKLNIFVVLNPGITTGTFPSLISIVLSVVSKASSCSAILLNAWHYEASWSMTEKLIYERHLILHVPTLYIYCSQTFFFKTVPADALSPTKSCDTSWFGRLQRPTAGHSYPATIWKLLIHFQYWIWFKRIRHCFVFKFSLILFSFNHLCLGWYFSLENTW